MKKILIISYNYPPDNAPAAQRPAAFHKYLETNSIVLTPENAVSALGSEKEIDKNLEENVIRFGSVSILNSNAASTIQKSKGKSLKKRIFNELKIPDKAIVWLRSALKKGHEILKQDKDITHIFSSSPSVVNHLVAMRLAKRYKKKWIADFRDYYFIETIEKGDYIFRKPIDKRIESRILKRADHITFISDWMNKEYERRYPFIKEKSSAIYNGFDPDEFGFHNQNLSDKLTIFYAGTFYEGLRSPLPLFDLLDNLSREKKIDLNKISIEVAGKISEELRNKISERNSGQCFKFLGLLPRSEILQRYSSAHLLWLIIGNSLNHFSGYPIKGYEYMGSGRPTLLFTPIPSEAANIISSLNAGYIFDSSNPEKHEDNFLRIYRNFLDGRLSKRISKDGLNKFSRVTQAKQLDSIINEIR